MLPVKQYFEVVEYKFSKNGYPSPAEEMKLNNDYQRSKILFGFLVIWYVQMPAAHAVWMFFCLRGKPHNPKTGINFSVLR